MASSASGTPTAPTGLTGKWKPNLSRSDDIDPFLAEVGLPWPIRMLARRSTPVMHLTVTDSTFASVTDGAFGKRIENTGTFGEVRGLVIVVETARGLSVAGNGLAFSRGDEPSKAGAGRRRFVDGLMQRACLTGVSRREYRDHCALAQLQGRRGPAHLHLSPWG
jgi:hypothetical protein